MWWQQPFGFMTPRSSETWLIYEPTILHGLPAASDKVVMDVANLMVACVCMSVNVHVCFPFHSRESQRQQYGSGEAIQFKRGCSRVTLAIFTNIVEVLLADRTIKTNKHC